MACRTIPVLTHPQYGASLIMGHINMYSAGSLNLLKELLANCVALHESLEVERGVVYGGPQRPDVRRHAGHHLRQTRLGPLPELGHLLCGHHGLWGESGDGQTMWGESGDRSDSVGGEWRQVRWCGGRVETGQTIRGENGDRSDNVGGEWRQVRQCGGEWRQLKQCGGRVETGQTGGESGDSLNNVGGE